MSLAHARLRAAQAVSVAGARNFSVGAKANLWNHVKMGPKDPILGVTEAWKADPNPNKINVGVGAYRTDDGKPWVLPSVREAQAIVLGTSDHEYPPISGVPEFVSASINLAYGANSDVIKEKRVAAVQSLSGTGALRLSSNFLAMNGLGQAAGGAKPKVLLPNPTWGNHLPIYNQSGIETPYYRYWDAKTKGIDMKGLLEDIKSHSNQVVLLHSCAHNPTGVDPTLEQWQEISHACAKAGHFVIFDNAYQGFASGDPDRDVAAVRLFIADGHNIGLCQSFAKNFGLYGQRVGAYSMVCSNADEAARVESQLKICARAIYSNPPAFGAKIVATILNSPRLTQTWKGEIKTMANRIIAMRTELRKHLEANNKALPWNHITDQIGMFSYTGMTPEQVDAITAKHNVYMTRNGRVSMAGVTSKNVERLARAIADVTKV